MIVLRTLVGRIWPRGSRKASLRGRLVLINLIGSGATFLLISTALVANEYLTHLSALLDNLEAMVKAVGESGTRALNANDRAAATSSIMRVAAIPEVTQAAIFDAGGKPVARFRAPGQSFTLTALAPVAATRFRITHLDVTMPVAIARGDPGSVRIEASLGSINRQLLWYAVVVGCAGLAGLGIAVLLIDRMLVTASRPLRQLLRLMEIVSSEETCLVRAPVHKEDEIGALARGFNRMLLRIQERERDLKRELTERRRAERRLARLAHYDTLTRLPNRNYFNERLTALLDAAGRAGHMVALLFIDLDDFKIVNDTLGHSVGDMLLKAVAARLQKNVRESDAVCRLGGDEFTIILADIGSAEHAGQVAEAVVGALSHPFRIVDRDVHVSCSAGISLYPRDADDAAKLMRCGDMAMYHAKTCGRNNFQFFSGEMETRARNRLTVETGLRRGLERSEFLLHYQPQIDLRTGDMVGAEALIRWDDPDRGIIGPDHFIPVAEDTGLIVPIGEWILWAACSQASIWQRTGYPPIRISVNLSARQFRERTIVRTIANVLEETGLDPSLLVLELTETVLLEDSDAANTKAQELRAMGVVLAIDDFGTGFSSIAYLRRLPINEIKIDRSYVGGMPGDTDGAGLVQAIIAMAQVLGIEVVAEGVETWAQLEFLVAHQCTRAQGHLIAAAMPAAELEARLRARRRQPLQAPRPMEPLAIAAH